MGYEKPKIRAELGSPGSNVSVSDQLPAEGVTADHFIIRDGRCFAGTHVILDLWGAQHLADVRALEEAMIAAVDAAGATLLHIHLHPFPGGGVSGVAVLAESHISIHTWPEREYAAIDIFMCGDAAPECAVEVLERALRPARKGVDFILRGELA